MKPTLYLFTLFLLTLMTACTDSITGPEPDFQAPENVASSSSRERIADLSVYMGDVTRIDPYKNFKFQVKLGNDGPDVATGVQLQLRTDGICYDETNDPMDLVWDFVDVDPNTSLTFEVVCEVEGPDPVEATVEVMASDAADPDSTPANGDPEEDDQDTLRF